MHDSVEVPDPLGMLVALKEHDRLVELVVTARVTVPVKLFSGATVMMEVPVAPARIVALVGLAIIV